VRNFNKLKDKEVLSKYEDSKVTHNVEAWRSAGHSIPSAGLANVDFYSQLKLRLIAQ
jgi:hypothetical protein